MTQASDLPEEIRAFYEKRQVPITRVLRVGLLFTRKFKVHRGDNKHDLWQKNLGRWSKVIDAVDDDLASTKDEATIIKFKYVDGTDTFPLVLVLSQYQHQRTDTCLVCGINLHYLGPKLHAKLMESLPDLLQQEDGTKRYRYGMEHLPQVFRTGYRAYDERMMLHISRSRIAVKKA
jgi:hypothetical protein